MAQSGPDYYGLQGEMARAHSSQIAQRLGNMTTAIPGLLDRFDAVSLILLLVTLIAFLIPVFILFPPIPVERSDALRQTHKRIGLPPQQSNLKSQTQQASIHGAQANKSAKVQGLYIYPVKSCRGIELARSKILPTGLEYDRLYTLAQLKPPNPMAAKSEETERMGPVWDFFTIRQFPLMANVKVDLWVPDPAKSSRQLGKVDEAFLVLRFPWTDRGLRGVVQRAAAKLSKGLQGVPEKEFMLPVAFPSAEEVKARGYTYANVKVWKDTKMALNLEKEIPPELAQYLGVKYRLGIFRIDPSNHREVYRCAPRKDVLGYQSIIGFQDAVSSMPLIIKNESLMCA